MLMFYAKSGCISHGKRCIENVLSRKEKSGAWTIGGTSGGKRAEEEEAGDNLPRYFSPFFSVQSQIISSIAKMTRTGEKHTFLYFSLYTPATPQRRLPPAPVLFQVQPEKKKASWHKIRLHCNLFPLLSASFWEWMASSFGPDDGGG